MHVTPTTNMYGMIFEVIRIPNGMNFVYIYIYTPYYIPCSKKGATKLNFNRFLIFYQRKRELNLQ